MSLTVSGSSITFPDASAQSTAATGFGFKNRIINGNMVLAQRATSATVTAGTAVPTASTGYPCVDRFFVYSTGANVTAAQVAGAGAIQYRLQITGAASVTAVGVGQRIEQKNSYDMAGSTATLSVELANTALSTVTWTASYATTADTFGTIGTPTKTQIATGTFTVNSTSTVYSTQISIPAAATTGIEVLFTVGAQTSGTFTVGQVQLTKSATLEAFDYRPYGTELALCQRYLPAFNSTGFPYAIAGGYAASTNAVNLAIPFLTQARIPPTGVSVSSASHIQWASTGNAAATVASFNIASNTNGVISLTVTATAGQGGLAYFNNASGQILFTGCEL
jgi:hypothetical protein